MGLAVRLAIEAEVVRSLIRVFGFALGKLTENEGPIASGNIKGLPKSPKDYRVIIGGSGVPRVAA
ncbi:hypothetical protein DFQ13_105534 [Actinokineospora spheciospongiae]|nr:hypothetical protein DFQ13_105534 [Actinokineospora spheciospongiae]